MSFVTAQPNSALAEVREDGSSKARRLPAGDATITVDTSSFKPPRVARGFKPQPGVQAPEGYDLEARAKRYTPIPEPCASPEQSGPK